MEITTILQERVGARLTLRELSDLLGPGFSPAKLSLVERGLIPVTAHDEKRILETIRRVAQLSRARKQAIAAAKKIDLKEFTHFVAPISRSRRQAIAAAKQISLKEFVVDLREGRSSACA